MNKDRRLYRIPSQGRFAGVCAGISKYFGLELWLVRILFFTVLVTNPFIFTLSYVALWFILDKDTSVEQHKARRKVSNFSGLSEQLSSQYHEQPIEVKRTVWQSGEPPVRAFADITHRYQVLEQRLQRMEQYVTSTEFTLSREINRL